MNRGITGGLNCEKWTECVHSIWGFGQNLITLNEFDQAQGEGCQTLMVKSPDPNLS
jgi:hypothetical protein